MGEHECSRWLVWQFRNKLWGSYGGPLWATRLRIALFLEGWEYFCWGNYFWMQFPLWLAGCGRPWDLPALVIITAVDHLIASGDQFQAAKACRCFYSTLSDLMNTLTVLLAALGKHAGWELGLSWKTLPIFSWNGDLCSFKLFTWCITLASRKDSCGAMLSYHGHALA